MNIQRYAASFLSDESLLEPGDIFRKLDGTLWYVDTNGDQKSLTSGGGGSLTVGDGETEVADVTAIVFSGGTVTDAGAGEADVAVGADAGAKPTFVVSFTGLWGQVQQNAVFDPVSSPGTFGAMVSIPTALAGTNQHVADSLEVLIRNVPDIDDDYDLSATLTVWDNDEANTIEVVASATLSTPIGSGGSSIDWTTASVINQTGVDLSWDTDALAVVSAGGGNFSAMLVAKGELD